MISLRERGRQAAGLAELYRPLPPRPAMGRAIAIASGKGGVGKTSVAVNLGLALAQRGQRVLLFDGDLSLANADVLLGVRPEATLRDVVTGRCRLAEVVLPVETGLHLAPGGSGLSELVHLDRMGRRQLLFELAHLERAYDFVLMDLAAGLGDEVVQLLASSDEVLVVTTPEPTALTDAYALIKVAHTGPADARFALVVNQARGEGEGHDAAERLAKVARAFLDVALPLWGVLPLCDDVPRSVRSQVPALVASPEGPFSRAVRAMAADLVGQARPADSRWGVAGAVHAWFQRLTAPVAP